MPVSAPGNATAPIWRAPLNRPLVWVAAGLALGIYAAATGWTADLVGAAVGILAAVCFGIAVSDRIAGRLASVVVAAFCCGVALWILRSGGTSETTLFSQFLAERPTQTEYVVEGRVCLSGLERVAEEQVFVLEVERVFVSGMWYEFTDGVSVNWKKPGLALYADDRVRVRGTLTTNLGRRNPGVGSYEEYAHRQGIHASMRVWGADAVTGIATSPWWSPTRWASIIRTAQADRLARTVPAEVLPFILAVWLGQRTQMTDTEYDAYLESGTFHILSVSGIHLGMVYITAGFLLRMFIRSRRWRAVCIVFLVLLFTLMSGLRPSALRSAVMIMVYLAAEIMDREPDALSALAWSAILLLIMQPVVLFDEGFQLSFLSIASILLFSPLIHERLHHLPRTLSGTTATSLAAQILPLPVAVRIFHVMPLGAIPANLIIVPLTTIVLWLSLGTSICAFIWEPLATLFGHTLWPTVWLIRATAQCISAPVWSHLTLVSPLPVAVVAYYALWLPVSAWMAGEREKKYGIALVVLAAIVIVCWSPWHPAAQVTFLDVGHGDATFIRTAKGKTLLMDGGDCFNGYDMGRRAVAPFLWTNQVHQLDYVALSHPDRDHIGGLFHILRKFRVGTVLLGTVLSERPAEEALIRLCAERGIPVKRLKAGDEIQDRDLTLTVLHPKEGQSQSDVNDNSFVLRVSWQGLRILLPGDVERAGERMLVQQDCSADVLKVPHHGSATSSSQMFLNAVKPTDCIVSTGGSSGHEHFDETVLQRYRQAGIRIWRTDQMGAITLRQGQRGITWTQERPVRIESARSKAFNIGTAYGQLLANHP